ncbi:6-phosphogluconolactonase [Lysobacter korlensis]|uniref:6-phosphogluconolactonase n=1 Tax=Lysobacter korlensis TaxID=553636 RepID=A0ABV6RHP3_9GAMM
MTGSTDPRSTGARATPEWHEYSSAERLGAGLAEKLAAICVDALNERALAWLALAGGRTPLPAYRHLAGMPGIDWGRVVAVPTDERCVPHEHPACNLSELGNALHDANGISIITLTRPDGDAEASAMFAQRELNARAQPFDAVVLGMGADAHTASLFPGAAQLAAALDLQTHEDALRIDPDPLPPEAPFARITLTAKRLLRTRELHVVITGDAKRGVLERALASGDVHAHPIAIVLQAPQAHLHLHWSP